MKIEEVGVIILASKGVSFPGRYGHGKPGKPVNTALSALHRFQSYIISVIIYRVSVFVYGETVKNKWINDNVRKGLFNGSFLLSALEKWSFRAIG